MHSYRIRSAVWWPKWGWTRRHDVAAVCERDDTIKKIAAMQYPTDPSHVETLNIKCDNSYISMCCSVGPGQPDMAYPKNAKGQSFQKQWLSVNVWLEYSPTANWIHCFSCRLFLTEEKYKNRTAWTTDGIRKWNTALEKIKQHSITEMHMTSMVKKALQSAFDVSDVKGMELREQERQINREILTKLIDLTVYLAHQGQAFRGHDESKSSNNCGSFLELVDVFSRWWQCAEYTYEKKLPKFKSPRQGPKCHCSLIEAKMT